MPARIALGPATRRSCSRFWRPGLRLNELRELRLADTNIARPIEESFLFVRAETSKGKESRNVRLDRIAAQAVHEYSKDWRANRHDDGPLFLTAEGEPFSLNGFQTYMGRLGDRFEAAGIANWMAHRAGMSVFDIAAEGGWKDLKMVQALHQGAAVRRTATHAHTALRGARQTRELES